VDRSGDDAGACGSWAREACEASRRCEAPPEMGLRSMRAAPPERGRRGWESVPSGRVVVVLVVQWGIGGAAGGASNASGTSGDGPSGLGELVEQATRHLRRSNDVVVVTDRRWCGVEAVEMWVVRVWRCDAGLVGRSRLAAPPEMVRRSCEKVSSGRRCRRAVALRLARARGAALVVGPGRSPGVLVVNHY
jgi:hypothetical protein